MDKTEQTLIAKDIEAWCDHVDVNWSGHINLC